MIRCNLAVLLAERNIKISRVSQETGISRTTLTSLSSNYSQGIQFDTMNTLCTYLDTTPDNLISFFPVDIQVLGASQQRPATYSDMTADIRINFVEHGRSLLCVLLAKVTCAYDELVPCFSVILDVYKDESGEFTKNTNSLVRSISNLPIPFKRDLSEKIFAQLTAIWPEHYKPVLLSFLWPACGD